jgi:three-Cys-motif partner protein
MPDVIRIRETPTKVKHWILEKYLQVWGHIILNGCKYQAQKRISAGKQFDLHFVYVDCDAGSGRYLGEREDHEAGRPLTEVYGSPIIGIQALDALAESAAKIGIEARTNVILIEQKKPEFTELKRTLEITGLSGRVRETSDFHSLSDGQIALVRGDSTKMAGQLTEYTQRSPYTRSFYFLDPYGPKGVPLHFVGEVIRHLRHDVIIYMPYYDLHKKSGLAPKDYLSQSEEELIDNYVAMFGSSRWLNDIRELYSAAKTKNTRALEEREKRLVEHYRETLQLTDPALAIKLIPLTMSGQARTMYYLYLTTHDPTGALKMNALVAEALLKQDELRLRLIDTRTQVKSGGQLMLFDVSETDPPASAPPPRATKEEIANAIYDRFRGQAPTQRQLYQAFANSDYFVSEIGTALTHLKKQGKADYPSGRSNDTLIRFS